MRIIRIWVNRVDSLLYQLTKLTSATFFSHRNKKINILKLDVGSSASPCFESKFERLKATYNYICFLSGTCNFQNSDT